MVFSSLGVCLSLKKALRMTIIINYRSSYNNQLICPKFKRKPFSLNKSHKSYSTCNSPQHHVNLSSAFSHTDTGREAILYHIFPIFLRLLPAQEPRVPEALVLLEQTRALSAVWCPSHPAPRTPDLPEPRSRFGHLSARSGAGSAFKSRFSPGTPALPLRAPSGGMERLAPRPAPSIAK